MSTNVQFSTGLRNAMMASASLKASLDNGFINIYAGTMPTSADDALGGATLLVTISNNSTGSGLTFGATASTGVLSKGTAVWSGTNVASGTAAFWRFVAAADSGTSSTSQPRMQGSVGTTDGSINLSLGTTLLSGGTTPIDSFAVELPTY